MTATERPSECREKFEHWYALNDPARKSVERDGFGYRLMQAHQAWAAWQAAWNARTLDAAPADPVVSAEPDMEVYIDSDTGTKFADVVHRGPEQQLSILFMKNGDVGYAVYMHGHRIHGRFPRSMLDSAKEQSRGR